MDTPATVLLTRWVLVLYATLQLTFEWLYLGSWYWLPKLHVRLESAFTMRWKPHYGRNTHVEPILA
jgi:hypothetical protein